MYKVIAVISGGTCQTQVSDLPDNFPVVFEVLDYDNYRATPPGPEREEFHAIAREYARLSGEPEHDCVLPDGDHEM